MKSDMLRAIDQVALSRPWKWTDGTLLWNEEVDHCVLSHDGTNWPVTPENRAAIESALNHMPALISLVAACERRRLALDTRSEFGSRSYRENPYSILSEEFKEQVARLDGIIRVAEHDLDSALIDVCAVNAPSSTNPSSTNPSSTDPSSTDASAGVVDSRSVLGLRHLWSLQHRETVLLSSSSGEPVAVQSAWRVGPPTVNEVRTCQWWWHRTRSGGTTIGPSLIRLGVDLDGCIYLVEGSSALFEPDDWGTEWAPCHPP